MRLGNTRGVSLGATVLVIAVCTLLAMAAASATIFNFLFQTQLDTQAQARDLARGALNLTLTKLRADPDLGSAGTESIEIAGDQDYGQDALGIVTFDPARAGELKFQRSTNNLRVDAAAPGDGRSVPRNSVHLVALGQSGDSRVLMDAIYYMPPFSTGASATGVVSVEGLTLAALRNPELFNPSTGFAAIPPEQLEPASLRSLSATAMEIGPECDIYGDAQATGEVRLDPTSLVRGRVQTFVDPVLPPRLNISEQIGRIETLATTPTFFENVPISAYQVYNTSQTVSALNLDGGVLCVRGNLTVNGPVTGNGAVLVTGDLTLTQGASLRTGDTIVCAAGGDLTLTGLDRASYFFQGLLYSEGNIFCRDITILGTIVANGQSASAGTGDLTLRNVDVIQTGISASLAYGPPADSSTLGNGLAQGGGGVNAAHNDDFWIQINRRTDTLGKPLYDARILFEFDEDQRPDDNGSSMDHDRIWDRNYHLFNVDEDQLRHAVRAIFAGGTDPQRTNMNDPTPSELRGDEVDRLVLIPGGFSHLDNDPFKSIFEDYMTDLADGASSGLLLDFRLSELAPEASRPRMLLMRERQARQPDF